MELYLRPIEETFKEVYNRRHGIIEPIKQYHLAIPLGVFSLDEFGKSVNVENGHAFNNLQIFLIFNESIGKFRFVFYHKNMRESSDSRYLCIIKLKDEKVVDECVSLKPLLDGEDVVEESQFKVRLITREEYDGSSFYYSIEIDGEKYSLDEIENLMVEYVHLYNKTKKSLSTFQSFLEQYAKDYMMEKERVDKYNLNDILKGLRIYVDEYFGHNVGKDDTYSVTETRSVRYPVDELDDYLKKFLGIGRRITHSDRGYTTAESMRIKGLKTGEYSQKEVEPIRQKLIEEYSKEKHIANNVAFSGENTLKDINKIIECRYGRTCGITYYKNLMYYKYLIPYLFSASFGCAVNDVATGEYDCIAEFYEKMESKALALTWWK